MAAQGALCYTAFQMKKSAVEIISKKRDGGEHTEDEIAALVEGFTQGTLADYQMSAWLMATYLRGMTDTETVALTRCMLHSGKVLELASVCGTKVDKHSTGGVGDKVSICLAPIVASLGVPVPMVSGRGLGHTGGTLDKLEAIPGFRTDLSTEDFTRIVSETGACLIGQTQDIAPADKRIYALRDVTGTVECIPLIVASILSKKLAEGIDALVLDVKVGRGAFMKTLERARALAEALVRVGTQAGKNVVAVLTNMDAPLGTAVGNAIETKEALLLLHGEGPPDLLENTLLLAAHMLMLGGRADTEEQARALAHEAIRSGRALETMEKLVQAQQGDPRVVSDPRRLPVAPMAVNLVSDQSGYVVSVDALEVGLVSVAMGAGRLRAEDKVDPTVGIEILKKPGDAVQAGELLGRMHVHKDESPLASRLRKAFAIKDAPPKPAPFLYGTIT